MRKGKLNKLEQSYLRWFKNASHVTAMLSNVLAIILFIYLAIAKLQAFNFISLILIFFGGIVFWTLIEYLIHRYIFHDFEEKLITKKLQYLIHGIHHASPENTIFIPLLLRISLLSILFILFKLIIGLKVFIFFAGFLTGFSVYSFLHFAIHTIDEPRFLNYLWDHHKAHHYRTPDKAYGTSTRLWDWVFRTMP
ncbi:MAG: sterol desaturase family protein [Bacteroidota bacterium]